MLNRFCYQLTDVNLPALPKDHKLAARLVCPEYSKSTPETKTYPLLQEEQIFVLCWNINANASLRTTLAPSQENFCYQFDFSSGQKTQLHTHDYIELTYVVKGSFRQKILGKDIIFNEGDLCLIDKNCLHQDYLFAEPAIILFFGISNEIFQEIMNENVAAEKIHGFLQSALLKQKDLQQYLHFRPGTGSENTTAELEKNLLLLLNELYDSDTGTRYIRKGLLLRIFRILSTQYEFSLSRELQKTMNWIVFEEISDYIQKNASTVTIQHLMKQFHFQEDYFNRLIKKKTGMTYSAYVQQIRLEKAEHLLLTSSKNIEEIAEDVGYHNKGYFYKIFQKKYGMTPFEFRKHP